MKTQSIFTRENREIRIYFWDYMKAFAMVLVIINHSLDAKTSLWFVGIIRMAVPIFLLTSGVTFSLSIRKVDSVAAWYAPKKFLKKICYFSFPPISLCFAYAFIKETGIYGFICSIILADYGMGAYYYNIIMQLMLIFPIIYIIINKNGGGYMVYCWN